MRRIDFRWFVAFGGSFIFIVAFGQINHHLAHTPLIGGTVYLFTVGLPVAFAALRLSLGQGLATTLATTLLAEAGLPLGHGVIILPAVACICLTHALRVNFNRLNPSSAIVVTLAINLVLMVGITLATRVSTPADYWGRMAADILLSQVVVALLTGWFFSAQIALLRTFGFNLETELRESP